MSTVDVAIPKLRQGSYFPEWLLERRKRAEAALISVVATLLYLLGVSTRRMDKLVATLGVTSLSRSQVSRMSADLDEQVEAFHTRPLGEAGPFTFVAADALTMKVREDGRVVNAVVLVPDHRRTRSAFGMCMPVQIVEQVRWPHLDQTYTPPGEEPQEVEHVIRVRAPRRPGEVSALQVRQKSINHRDVVAPPGGDITGKKEHISVAGYPKHHRHLQSAKPPTSSVSTDKPRRWDLTCAERVALARAG